MLSHRYPETWALRDAMRDLIGPTRRGLISDRYPQTAAEIFDALRADWGTVTHRRLWRTLWWLMSRGYVVRLGTPRGTPAYVQCYAPMRADEHDQRMAVEYVSNGLCWNCGLETSSVQCPGCRRNRQTRYGRELYRAFVDAGICVVCHGQYAADGRVSCPGCLEADAKRKRAA